MASSDVQLDNTMSSSSSSSSSSSFSSNDESNSEDEEVINVALEPAEIEIEISNTTYPMVAKPFEKTSMKIRNMKEVALELKLYIDDRSIQRNYFYFVHGDADKARLVMTNSVRLYPAEEMTVNIMYAPRDETKERYGFIILYSQGLKETVTYPVIGTEKHYDFPDIEERVNPFTTYSEE